LLSLHVTLPLVGDDATAQLFNRLLGSGEKPLQLESLVWTAPHTAGGRRFVDSEPTTAIAGGEDSVARCLAAVPSLTRLTVSHSKTCLRNTRWGPLSALTNLVELSLPLNALQYDTNHREYATTAADLLLLTVLTRLRHLHAAPCIPNPRFLLALVVAMPSLVTVIATTAGQGAQWGTLTRREFMVRCTGPVLPTEALPVAGSDIDCLDTDRNWLRARVLRVLGTRAMVHYTGWEDKWDEWIDMDHLRIRPPGTVLPLDAPTGPRVK
jgi:hypothetical protein